MPFIRRAATALLALLILLVAVAYLLPREVRVARSITIDAPPDAVFPFLNSLEESAKWSPWLDRDPEAQLSYSGPASGVGNTLEWASEHPQVGHGKQTITESAANAHVTTALDFGDMGTAQAAFSLAPAGTGTLVTWSFQSDMGLNPLARWMGLMMDRWVGTDYEQGLSNLKALVEDT